jgi:hypothetical protein
VRSTGTDSSLDTQPSAVPPELGGQASPYCEWYCSHHAACASGGSAAHSSGVGMVNPPTAFSPDHSACACCHDSASAGSSASGAATASMPIGAVAMGSGVCSVGGA